jgi:hypothetical protein
MARHFHRLIEWRGEHLACLQFRKVANWYCKTLRPGKEIKMMLMQLDSVATFERLVDQLREQGEPSDWAEHDAVEPNIPVPSGPIAHW